MRSSLVKMKLNIIAAALLFSAFIHGKKYTPDWKSLDARPLPSWYDEAKVGIFMHFYPAVVAGFKPNWFWYRWKSNQTDIVNFVNQNYPPKFTYQDFGPQVTMEFFNPSWFADVVAASGAKYFVFTTKHHDGFVHFNSSYAFGWNSVDVGPKRNVVKELKDAFASRHPEIHFGIYYSLYEWFNPMWQKDKKNRFRTREYVLNKMIPEMKELANLVEPHVWWSDGDWESTPEYFGSKEFLTWLYNESPAKDYVVTNDRWGQGTKLHHGGYYSGPDGWHPGHIVEHKWESCVTLEKRAWPYRKDIKIEDLHTPEELIEEVQCNQNEMTVFGFSETYMA